MDEILIHVSSEIVFSVLKNRKRNPVNAVLADLTR